MKYLEVFLCLFNSELNGLVNKGNEKGCVYMGETAGCICTKESAVLQRFSPRL